MPKIIRLSINILLIYLLGCQLCYAGGIIVGRTRIIYEADKKEASLPLTNNSENIPFLIQSWIDTGDGKSRGPFVVTPPLFRLNAKQENTLRISYTGSELPSDKESIFYINVRVVPSSPKNNTNELKLVFKSRIKLFYRPQNLSGRSAEAYKSLTFFRDHNELRITNPSPYYVVFSSLKLGNTPLKDTDMIAPGAQITVKLPPDISGNIIRWGAINDFGGSSAFEERTL
jgi:fimbrial chaperone protein